MKRFIYILIIILFLIHSAAADLDIGMTIPVKNNKVFDPDKLVAGVTWHERARVELLNTGAETLNNIDVIVQVPMGMDIKLPTQELKDVHIDGNKITAKIADIQPGESATFLFEVKPPASVEFRKTATFSISAVYQDGEGVQSTQYTHDVEIIPPPSWITYGTIIASIFILIIVLVAAWKFQVLEMFTTIDLITIALLAGLIGVVFRWFWQTFNDLLGPLGGLLFTIPITVIMLVALQLVRKPGTATLLFTVVELVAMVIWGTNITIWLGWYMMEGVLVDALVILFKRDYGDRRFTAIIYGISRGAFSYWMFYFLYAPVVWKVYYAPWYGWTEVGIAAVGGLIGGIIGYDIAKKMRGAMI